MRWLGDMTGVFALGKTISHRVDAEKRRIPMPIPDHIDILGHFAQGGQVLQFLLLSGSRPPKLTCLFLNKRNASSSSKKDAEIELFAGDKSLPTGTHNDRTREKG